MRRWAIIVGVPADVIHVVGRRSALRPATDRVGRRAGGRHGEAHGGGRAGGAFRYAGRGYGQVRARFVVGDGDAVAGRGAHSVARARRHRGRDRAGGLVDSVVRDIRGGLFRRRIRRDGDRGRRTGQRVGAVNAEGQVDRQVRRGRGACRHGEPRLAALRGLRLARRDGDDGEGRVDGDSDGEGLIRWASEVGGPDGDFGRAQGNARHRDHRRVLTATVAVSVSEEPAV